MRLLPWPFLILGGLGCQPIPSPPVSLTPMNVGCPNDCSDFTPGIASCSPYQSGEVCLLNTDLNYVLVVSVPTSAPYGPGLTVVLPPSSATANGGRLTLPDPLDVEGVYVAQPSDPTTVNRYTYVPFGASTALPVHVTYYPEYGSLAATSVGLPLLPIEATQITSATNTVAATTYSPGVTQVQELDGWSAQLPVPGLMQISYLRNVSVDPPFASSFPPETRAAQSVDDDNFAVSQLGLGNPSPLVPGIETESGADMTGWQVYIEDSNSMLVSNVFTIPGASLSGPPPLYATSTTPLNGTSWTLFVQPADPAMPILFDPILDNSPLPTVVYPTPKPPLDVRGTVLTTGGQPVDATLVFASQTIDLADTKCAELPCTTPALVANVTTSTQKGSYSQSLYPGTYSVTVTPTTSPPSGTSYPKFTVTQTIAKPTVDFPIVPSPTVTGTCIVSETTPVPLANADVELTPAVYVVTQPRPWQLPRPVYTTTQANGSFSVAVDPGTYDVTVKPAAGSNLPWVVITSVVAMGSGSVSLPSGSCTVPAPVLESVTLEDEHGNVLPQTVVRAYAQDPKNTMQPSFYEIGMGLTDEGGHADLFLTGLN
jgi:hypothetical protein